jgi:probable H4MPT-linked C1 transfer pathway protein
VPRSVLGLDIGGANLKAAHSKGEARTRPFALWKAPAALPGMLADLLRGWPSYELLAVTMTGELCDCFATKREGVRVILDAVSAVAGPTRVRVWLSDGRFVDVATAQSDPLLAASANWLALATLAGRFAARGAALLIDVGSTTTDIVPLLDGKPVPRGRTDTERLRSRELTYTGVVRTPLCALLDEYGAAELFATTRDVYLMLGNLAEDASDCDTADGRPATRAFADARLARMICADLETSTADERRAVAQRAFLRQVEQIGKCISSVAHTLRPRPEVIVLSGAGEFLAELALAHVRQQITAQPWFVVSLGRQLGTELTRAAAAYALAVLAGELQR